jgi:glycosyltransferase involved in cell wall biosynthesis
LLVSQFHGEPLADAVAALATRADLVWAVRLFVAEAIRTGRERMIVDLDDVESVRESRRLAVLPADAWNLLCWLDNLKLRRLERGTPDRYARIVVASEGDRRLFHRRMAEKILVVPNGVPARLLDEPRGERPGPCLVFVANMRYAANVDAAFWFVREIFPRVRSQVTEARLWLVGHDDQGHVRELHDGDSIIVTGRVDDVVPFVTRAAVSVVPLRWGGGTRIKILESLALGTPVVSTTIGADGLDLLPGRDIVIADTPENFAESVLALLADRAHREALAAAGSRVVAARYTWEKMIRDLRASVVDWLGCSARPGDSPLPPRGPA